MILELIRKVLRVLILAWDRAWPARVQVVRSTERQREVDAETTALSLYQFEACPFCVKVRRQIRRLGLKIQLRNVRGSPVLREELLAGGGSYQTPCLRIAHADGRVQWLYESDDINAWLAERYSV